jgi:hypothetical protein
MPEVSKYEEIWNELQKGIGVNFSIPPVYNRPEDLDHLHKKMYEIFRKFMDPMMTKDLLYEIMEENFKEKREEVYKGIPVVGFWSVLEERLMNYSSIKPNERYKAAVSVGGIILPPTRKENEKKFSFMNIYIFYILCVFPN